MRSSERLWHAGQGHRHHLHGVVIEILHGHLRLPGHARCARVTMPMGLPVRAAWTLCLRGSACTKAGSSVNWVCLQKGQQVHKRCANDALVRGIAPHVIAHESPYPRRALMCPTEHIASLGQGRKLVMMLCHD